jgi:hypothetical protein
MPFGLIFGEQVTTWIVQLFEKELDLSEEGNRRIIESLKKCTHPVCYCRCGCGDPYFINPKGPDWKFRTNVVAYSGVDLVVLDIMQDWSVGSIEIQRDTPDLSEMTPVAVH